MTPNQQDVSLGWADESVPIGTHACYYYSDEETLRSSLDFLRVGLDEPGDFCVIFADQTRQGELQGWLRDDYGPGLDDLVTRGKLGFIPGASSIEGLLSSIGARLDKAVADGYTLIRFLGFIGWGKPGWPDEATLLDFESQVNDAVTHYPAVILCTYGVPDLSGTQLVSGGLQLHPVAMMGPSVAITNPFFRASRSQ